MPPTAEEDYRLRGRIEFLMEAVTYLYKHHKIDPSEFAGIQKPTTRKNHITGEGVEDRQGLINEGWNQAAKNLLTDVS